MSNPKRKYTKKSPYWDKISKQKPEAQNTNNFEPAMCGDNYYISNASENKKVPIVTTSAHVQLKML